MINKKLTLNSILLLSMGCAGCSAMFGSTYIEPVEGSTATIVLASYPDLYVQTFEKAEDCSGLSIIHAPKRPRQRVLVPADEPRSIAFIYSAAGPVRMGYSVEYSIEYTRCEIAITFVPRSGATYRAEPSKVVGGCSLHFHEVDPAGNFLETDFTERVYEIGMVNSSPFCTDDWPD